MTAARHYNNLSTHHSVNISIIDFIVILNRSMCNCNIITNWQLKLSRLTTNLTGTQIHDTPWQVMTQHNCQYMTLRTQKFSQISGEVQGVLQFLEFHAAVHIKFSILQLPYMSKTNILTIKINTGCWIFMFQSCYLSDSYFYILCQMTGGGWTLV